MQRNTTHGSDPSGQPRWEEGEVRGSDRSADEAAGGPCTLQARTLVLGGVEAGVRRAPLSHRDPRTPSEKPDVLPWRLPSEDGIGCF